MLKILIRGHDVKKVWDNIKDICVNTIKSILPLLQKNYKNGTTDDTIKQRNNHICFTILY